MMAADPSVLLALGFPVHPSSASLDAKMLAIHLLQMRMDRADATLYLYPLCQETHEFVGLSQCPDARTEHIGFESLRERSHIYIEHLAAAAHFY
jgi:hypothetical protein